MPEKPKTYVVIDTEVIREHGVQYPNEDDARTDLNPGQTLLQAICSIEAVVTEYRRRDVASKDAKPSEPTTESKP